MLCFVCYGKGRIDFEPGRLEKYFEDLAKKKPE